MELNKYIDNTILRADAKESDIEKICKESVKHDFKSVCVNPLWVKLVRKLLKGSTVLTCTVIGFPLGANTIKQKVKETKLVIKDGAQEIDMVINIGAAVSKQWDYLLKEISAVKKACKELTLKVIVETALLDTATIAKLTKIVNESGANFIKTSTGFSTSGAKISDVQTMNKNRNEHLMIKASGGIKTKEDAMKMIKAGANRLGTSSGIQIIKK